MTALLDTLHSLGSERRSEHGLEYGERLIVPRAQDLGATIEYLMGVYKAMQQTFGDERSYPTHAHDLAQATEALLREFCGPLLFHDPDGESPVRMTTVQVSATEARSVPFGCWFAIPRPELRGCRFRIRGSYNEASGDYDDLSTGVVEAAGPGEKSVEMAGLLALIERELTRYSCLRGKAWRNVSEPAFYDLSGFDAGSFFYPESTQAALRRNLWLDIRHPESAARIGLSAKRSVLLYGPYGTGKTGAALATAQLCEQQGQTFIGCAPGDDFAAVMRIAQRYAPCVVFVEDIDTKAASHEEAERISAMLDVLDGIEAKTAGGAIRLVMTTNHPEALHQGVLRPGRIDATIEVGLPDAYAIGGIVRSRIGPDADSFSHGDWARIVAAADGYLPAFVAEGAGRASRAALDRCQGDDSLMSIAASDVEAGMHDMRGQHEMMRLAAEGPSVPTLDLAMGELVSRFTKPNLDAVEATAKESAAEAIEDTATDLVQEHGATLTEAVAEAASDGASGGAYNAYHELHG